MNILTLTDQEKNALIQLIDIAVKSGGLTVAEAAVVLSKKIAAAEPAQQLPTIQEE